MKQKEPPCTFEPEVGADVGVQHEDAVRLVPGEHVAEEVEAAGGAKRLELPQVPDRDPKVLRSNVHKPGELLLREHAQQDDLGDPRNLGAPIGCRDGNLMAR